MKIALLQCDVITGDISGNAKKLVGACERARQAGAVLCVAPTQALAGPDCSFFARLPWFSGEYRAAIDHLAKELENGPALLCGQPHNPGCALLLSGGCPATVRDEFYFERNLIHIGPLPSNSVFQPAETGPDMGIDLVAWPFCPGEREHREKALAHSAASEKMWLISANLAGGYDGVIYSGQSVAFDPYGRLWARGQAFAEDVVIVDTEAQFPGEISEPCSDTLAAQWRGLMLGVSDFATKIGVSRALLGLSGGMDSALVACVAAEALGAANVTGILMPSPWSSAASVKDANDLAANLGINTLQLPITEPLQVLETTLEPVMKKFHALPNDLTRENLQARIRGILLMAAANRSGAIVLNTGNKSELSMGYCTLYGDTCGALAVLGDLYKTRVYELANWYCDQRGKKIIPQNIFAKPPSAELRPDQKDTDNLPPYDILDPILEKLLTRSQTEEETPLMREIGQKLISSRFKARQCPPPIMVGGGC